ncbi:MAG: hypothetical protein V3U96_01540 [Paracoccaceae bacterium]
MEQLFENEHYRAVRTDCNESSDITVINFEPWRHSRSANETLPFENVKQDNFINQKGMNAIFLQTRRNDWYQSDGILDAIDSIVKDRRRKEVFVNYGTSMGGMLPHRFRQL